MNTLKERMMARPPATPEEQRVAIVKLLALLTTKLCNAGGYDKSILRGALLRMPDTEEARQELLDFEGEVGDAMHEVADALGYRFAFEPYTISCRCNGYCREWKEAS